MIRPSRRGAAGVGGWLLLAGAVAILVLACHGRPAAGAKCRSGEPMACVAKYRAIVCEDGAWAEMACRGALGCAVHGDSADCDDTVSTEGDLCPHEPPVDYACTPDQADSLVCRAGHFQVWRRCRGPERCRVEGGRNVRCDTTLGEPGDPCGQAGTYSCSVDETALLACDGTSLRTASSCRGPAGCLVERESRKVDCDDVVAAEGDACDQDKRITCSVDGGAELVCEGSKYARKRECRRSTCRIGGNELFCD